MKEKNSPIEKLWSWAKPYHINFIGSVVLAVLGVASEMVPYFCVAAIIRLLLAGTASWNICMEWCVIALWQSAFRQSFPPDFAYSYLPYPARPAQGNDSEVGPGSHGDGAGHTFRTV